MLPKELDYDAQGNLSASMELLEYTVAEQDIPLMYWVATIVGAIAIVGIAVGLVTIKKRNAKKTITP